MALWNICIQCLRVPTLLVVVVYIIIYGKMFCGNLLWIYILISFSIGIFTLDFRIKTKPYSGFKLRHRPSFALKPGKPYKGQPYWYKPAAQNTFANNYHADIR